MFPKVCFWRLSLFSNLAGIDPEKLYRATSICQYDLCCRIVWLSFLFDCFVIGNLPEFFGQTVSRAGGGGGGGGGVGKRFTAPPPPPPDWQKIVRTPMTMKDQQTYHLSSSRVILSPGYR